MGNLRVAVIGTGAVTVIDDPESLLKLNQMCLIAGTDMVAVAVDERRVTVECFPFGSSADRACLQCNLPDETCVRIAECYSSDASSALAASHSR